MIISYQGNINPEDQYFIFPDRRLKMKNPRPGPLTNFAIIITVLFLLYFLNNIIFSKSPEVQVSELVSKHKGTILFLKSDTEKDKFFKKTLNEIRPELKGGAGIITVKKRNRKDFSESGQANLLPTLVIIDSHGNELHSFVDSIDRKVLNELVHQLSTHHH